MYSYAIRQKPILFENGGYFFIWSNFKNTTVKDRTYKKITFGVLAAGFSYRLRNLEFTYGIGQYLILSSEEKGEIGGEGGAGEDEKWYRISSNDLKEAWETIKENPGGTLHAFEIRWFF